MSHFFKFPGGLCEDLTVTINYGFSTYIDKKPILRITTIKYYNKFPTKKQEKQLGKSPKLKLIQFKKQGK